MIFLERALALAAGAFSASVLHHFAPEASHTPSTFQPLLHARENTKAKTKKKKKASKDRHYKTLLD